MKTTLLYAALVCALAPAAALAAAASESELIPRSLLFSNPERTNVKVSPDGKYLSWVAPLNGVLNVWAAPIGSLDQAKPVTDDKARGISNYSWSYRADTVLYVRDSGGDENYHVYSANLATGAKRDLTDYPKTRASIAEVSPLHPDAILVSMNDRDPQRFDLYKVDLVSGERSLVQKNERFGGFVTDADLKVRMATLPKPDGSQEWLEPDGQGGWKSVGSVPIEDVLTTRTLGYTNDGKTLYSMDSRGRDTAALYATEVASGKKTVLLENPRADLSGILTDARSGQARAASVNYLREEWTPIGSEFAADLKTLAKLGPGEVAINAQTLDDKIWIVSYSAAESPGTYYRYDRAGKGKGKLTKLFDVRPALAGKPLVPMHPVEIRSRDGLNLVSYLTLPRGADADGDGRADKPVPMVLFVHGGPWARDEYGYAGTYQWLANRGYAVLNVNYRGSTGFGKQFLNKADGEFAGKMHEDLLDAVDWAVKQGVTTPDQVAIMGGSYGGYATLVGLTFTPTTFKCGVDIVGPANLVTLINSFPAYWGPQLESTWYKRVGDPRTEAGRKKLLERSPLTRVDAITRPLLIGHGANDPRVIQAESDALVEAMKKKGTPVTYALFPDEGHGFQRPENRMAFNAVAEGFLGSCLGGRVEPIGADFKGSSLQVPAGADGVEGLVEALKTHQAEVKK
ncbi:S9 family peptidase [Pseudomonas sp. CGJS7]|uniref:S9 family peptidase n=1 Tax=Pseudomonas sp. CGJS7 TaxID=3109348 RepID=UPI00300BE62A